MISDDKEIVVRPSKTGQTTTVPPPATSVTPSPGRAASNPTVYIAKTGEKYHTGTCRYVTQSKIAISLADAKARGYTPCSVCKPPQ